MDIQRLMKRVKELDPVVADAAMAVGLTVLVMLGIYLITNIHPRELPLPPGPRMMRVRLRPDYGVTPYLLAAATFLPLTLRRKLPALALVLSGTAAITYQVHPMPPAFTVLGPMIALYSLAAYTRRRHQSLIALLIAGMLLSVPVIALSGDVRWIAEAVGTFGLLAASALLGDTARNRREYIAEVENRAADLERTREDEARRRVDEERMRIAREVHDIVAHSLSIVTVQAAAAEAVLNKDPAQARESIKNIRATGREALGELRSMLDLLRTGERGDAPLSPSTDLSHLEQLFGPVREAGLEVDFTRKGDLHNVPAFASVSAYRIIQEALTNVVRHARAQRVAVAVVAGESELTIDILDDGRGASPEQLASGGHGLVGMRERVDALGGTFLTSAPASGGLQVSVRIPLIRSAG